MKLSQTPAASAPSCPKQKLFAALKAHLGGFPQTQYSTTQHGAQFQCILTVPQIEGQNQFAGELKDNRLSAERSAAEYTHKALAPNLKAAPVVSKPATMATGNASKPSAPIRVNAAQPRSEPAWKKRDSDWGGAGFNNFDFSNFNFGAMAWGNNSWWGQEPDWKKPRNDMFGMVPKTLLEQAVKRIVKRRLQPEDIVYTPEGSRQVTLSIPCLPDDYPVRSWTSGAKHGADAEGAVAMEAMRDLVGNGDFMAGIGRRKKYVPTEADLERTIIGDGNKTGVIRFFNARKQMGYIKLDEPFSFEGQDEPVDEVWFSCKDVQAGDVAKDQRVNFELYKDGIGKNNVGLGAQNIVVL